MKHTSRQLVWSLAAILWIGCIVGGFALLTREQFTPVRKTSGLSQFPPSAPFSLAVGQPTLVLFLHPRCPCSRATLGELRRILGDTSGRVAVDVVFTIAPGMPSGWEAGELWETCHAMPGLRVVRDTDGLVARQFHVAGSGHTLLYDESGRLLFSGGITASRGEEGDNIGEEAVVDLVLHGRAAVHQAPVFGCSLL